MLRKWCVWSVVFNGILGTTLWAQPAPNVIYIMLDDLGPGEYSVYDNLQGLGTTSKIDTPNINQLATQGMRFNNAHAATSLCAPTRAVVMAGAPTWQTNTRWGFGSASLQSGQQSVGDLMQSAGYRTGLMGKGHLGGDIYEVGSDNTAGKDISNLANMDFDRPLKDGMKEHGYDYTFNMIAGIQARPYFFWENDYATDTDANGVSTRIDNSNKFTMIRQWDEFYDDGVTEIWEDASGIGSVNWKTRDVPQAMLNKAVDFMDDSVTNASTQPFFLHYNSVAGHWPYVAPTDIQVDINDDGDTNDPGEFHDIDGYNGTGPAPDDLGTESMQMVSVSDAEVGVLVSYLEQTDDPRNPGHKLIDNTMIIYTSDNGGIGPDYTNQNGPLDRDEWDVYEHDSTSGLRENKAAHWEGGHRVPFIVQWGDNIQANSVMDQRISTIDLMGTLAGLTGQSLIDQGQGSHNLMPVFLGDRGDSDPIRKNLVVEDTGGASDGDVSRKLYYEDHWKLDMGTNATSPTIYEVYDLANDPAETNNLVSSTDPAVIDRINSMYANYLDERAATRMAPVFIGSNSSATVEQVSTYGDVDVEGVLEGQGIVNGNLDANDNSTIRVVAGQASSSQTITVTQDIRLDDDDTQYNSTRISVGLDGDLGVQRTALEFDLTQLNIPGGATVTDVEMVLTVGFSWSTSVNTSPTIEVYPLLTDFDETTATWSSPWNQPGLEAGVDYDDQTLLGTIDGFDPGTVGAGTQLVLDDASFMADVLANLTESEYQLFLKYDDISEALGQPNAMWINSNQLGSPSTQLIVTFDSAITQRSITVTGDYTQRDGSTLELSLGPGGSPGLDFDQLIVNGDIDLKGGVLDILLDAGFNPSLGDSFDILDFASFMGAFDAISLPALDAGLMWSTADLTTTGELVIVPEGDYDNDGFVGQSDLNLVLLNWGDSVSPEDWINQPVVDGAVSQNELDFVLLNWGNGTPPLVSASAVPEPTSLTMLLAASALGCFAFRRN